MLAGLLIFSDIFLENILHGLIPNIDFKNTFLGDLSGVGHHHHHHHHHHIIIIISKSYQITSSSFFLKPYLPKVAFSLSLKAFENLIESTQPAFTCSKLTTETLEQGVKYVQS